MNPSASGWIKKLLKEASKNNSFLNVESETFYNALRDCGFIYGSNFEVVCNVITNIDFTDEEISKTNLCLALLYTHTNASVETPFIESVINFYTEVNELKKSFFNDLLVGKKSSEQLEKIIHKRIQIDDNFITKNFNYFIINALLYVDILAYEAYLKNESISKDYIKNLESAIETISLEALNSKSSKNKYDESLIRLFESSLRYHQNSPIAYTDAIQHVKTNLEKYYVLDLACMATWSDKTIDSQEQLFLINLSTVLEIDTINIKLSMETVNTFYNVHRNQIALLNSNNMAKSFYNNASKMVKKLITRNSKRLYQELKDSKELMVLLTKSTQRDLTPKEQKKVQEQLIDIFKSIPSLAIFLLPGGALLLPLVIKFIPKLLPSAFDDNRIDD